MEIVQLLISALSVYRTFNGKPVLSDDERALLDAATTSIKIARRFIKRDDFFDILEQAELMEDIESIEESTGFSDPQDPSDDS